MIGMPSSHSLDICTEEAGDEDLGRHMRVRVVGWSV